MGRKSGVRVESAEEDAAAAVAEDGIRPSSLRPEKWGPDAASIT